MLDKSTAILQGIFTADCTPIMSRVYNSLYAVELLLMLTL